jgi:holliday junction DNA helicase RuvA
MYEFIKGKVSAMTPTSVILELAGIGWSMSCSVNTSRRFIVGKEAHVWTHLVVREDLLALYGFHSQTEREMFRQLISISGIGPKVAIAILSGMEADELGRVIVNAEVGRLTTVPGIGKKTAERLVLELRGRVENLEYLQPTEAQSGGAVAGTADSAFREAVEALIALGYKSAQAEVLIAKAGKQMTATDKPRVEELLKYALQNR